MSPPTFDFSPAMVSVWYDDRESDVDAVFRSLIGIGFRLCRRLQFSTDETELEFILELLALLESGKIEDFLKLFMIRESFFRHASASPFF